MDKAETHKWLVKFSKALNRSRKTIQTDTELELFDNFVRTFLADAPNWWSKGSDTDLQATASPELFFQSVVAESYPALSYRDVQEMEIIRKLNT